MNTKTAAAPKHVCPPAQRHLDDVAGCGNAFEQEPDREGWVDCPHCGLAFNAAQAIAEATGEPK